MPLPRYFMYFPGNYRWSAAFINMMGTIAYGGAEIARSKGRTIAQIALRWLVQQGNIIPIPRSSNRKRMAENLDVFDFTLTDDEMKRIGALKRADGRIANPAGRAPAWD